MRIPFIPFLFCFLAIVGSLTVSASSNAVNADYRSHYCSLLVANPVFLQQSGTSITAPGSGGPPQRSQLPNSTFPNTNAVCSSFTPDTNAKCSAKQSLGIKCSAHVDSGQLCSAGSVSGSTGDSLHCSALGTNKAACSILQPAANPVVINARCSASSDTAGVTVTCSVLAPGKKQACSTQNVVSINFNECSVTDLAVTDVRCSVIGGGTTDPNFCSAFVTPSSTLGTCSTRTHAGRCSIAQGQKGLCTAFKGATVGCSHGQTTQNCSTMLTAGGVTSGIKCQG